MESVRTHHLLLEHRLFIFSHHPQVKIVTRMMMDKQISQLTYCLVGLIFHNTKQLLFIDITRCTMYLSDL